MTGAQRASWSWRFDPPPERLWPLLADTARFNEAAAFPRHRIETETRADGTVIYTGHAKIGPFAVSWRDVPQEWVTNNGFRHARLFRNGPFKTLIATLQLAPEGTGTRCDYTLEVTPANLLGRLLLFAGFLRSAGKTFDKLIGEALAFAAGQRDQVFTVPVPAMTTETKSRLDAMAEDLRQQGADAALVDRLCRFITGGSELDLQRIRPLKLARQWQANERDVIELCLRAVRAGLLTLRWDLLCPNCRGGSGGATSLDQLPRGAHCPSCNIDYNRDFARNVELVFRPSAAVRSLSEGEFCLFGPMTTPHVVVQQTMAPDEIRELPARLPHGDYRLRLLNGSAEAIVVWRSGELPSLVALPDRVEAGPPAAAGTVRLVNRTGHEATLVIESRDWLRDALTAHRATSMQTFRDLFATEVLRPGDEAGIGLVTLMFTDLKGSTALYGRVGDAVAYRLVRDHFAFLAETVREHDGAIVKTIGDAVMASFTDPAQALKASLAVQQDVARFNREHDDDNHEAIVIKLGLHAGPCIVVNLNGRLDYFGSTVNLAARLQAQSQGGDIVLSQALAADAGVAKLLAGVEAKPETAMVKGFEQPVSFLRLQPR